MSATPSNLATRFRTVYVDPAVFTRIEQPDAPSASPKAMRLVGVEEQLTAVRSNVRDAARAVLTWLASVINQPSSNLTDELCACLRPGPDCESLNYTALAQRINAVCHSDYSPKRIRTAVENLRRAHREAEAQTHVDETDPLAAMHSKLLANIHELTADDPAQTLRQSIGTQVLGVVRCCAGRLIVKPFGEGIPTRPDPASLEGRLLSFVRDTLHDTPGHAEADLRQLLIALGQADNSGESDASIVVAGSRVVCDLLGSDSLAGLLAQINVAVVGRDLLGSELYTAELARFADAAAALHHDAETERYQNWARRLDETIRVPSALRVASYARNNLATHLLQRLITGEQGDTTDAFARANDAISAMRREDGSFQLLPITEAIHATALYVQNLDRNRVIELFQGLGAKAAAQLLQDLANFDSSREVVEAVHGCAIQALPQLRYQLIAL